MHEATLFTLLALFSGAFGGSTPGHRTIFGVEFRWESQIELSRRIDELESQFRESMDPDCRWRKPVNGRCLNSQPEQTKRLEELGETLRKETAGVFDIHAGAKRDFDGMSQGFFLETLKREMKLPWVGDFAGDIFVSPKSIPTKPLIIGDPLLESVTYARVEMSEGGWMIASGGKSMGGKLRNATDGFQKIVVFAEPSFDGARVDAWATAIVAGGKKVLPHLSSLKQYDGRWAYFGFGTDDKPFWSTNLTLEEINGTRLLHVPKWTSKRY